jgi:hypothetical protein
MAGNSRYAFEPSQYEVAPETFVAYEERLTETNSDDLVANLYDLQLIFLCDISGSMAEEDQDPEGKSTHGMFGNRWTRYDNMVKLLRTMVGELFAFDKDGNIPCYFFNDKVHSMSFTDPEKLVAQARSYRPGGSTNLAAALKKAAKDNLDSKQNFLFIIFTDGVPDSTAAVEEFIKKKIHKKDPKGDRINLLFIRFGDDRGAMQFLEDMDDHPIFGDNVDTKSDNAAYFLGPKLLVLNGMYEHLEKLPKYAAELAARP